MVADPADLEQGQTLGPADGQRETRAIEAYQQGKARAFQGSGASSAGASSSSGSSSGSGNSGSPGQ
jgi:type IV pilus biogenesis protein CpaD/CtpE